MTEFTTRDKFAARALTGIRSRNPRILDYPHATRGRTLSSQEVAKMAYEDADAMMIERSKA